MHKLKRVTDPIHGSILLTELEAKIVSSKAFQRLHNVRQLGLAYYVFPGGNYSRFSHSLGALHNATKMLASATASCIDDNKPRITSQEHALRLGALLHDIGHYPFSHATEHVIKNFYSRSMLTTIGQTDEPTPQVGIDHEALGRKVIENDQELMGIFEAADFDIKDVVAIFSKENPDNSLIGIISSDLDCDRLDYLKRTSHHTGLPYGSVDTDFLVSQASLDDQFRFCFSSKAIRAADHLLISRYYDYLQVPYNKTVCALEWSLTTCIEALLRLQKIQCDSESMIKKISEDDWHMFDDNYFFSEFTKLLKREGNSEISDVVEDHLKAILQRKPATTLFSWEMIVDRRDSSTVKSKKNHIEAVCQNFIRENGIDAERLKIWDHRVKFAKYGLEDAENGGDPVRIFDESIGSSKPLCAYPDVLFNQLIGKQHQGLRVFYLSKSSEDAFQVDQLKEKFCKMMA